MVVNETIVGEVDTHYSPERCVLPIQSIANVSLASIRSALRYAAGERSVREYPDPEQLDLMQLVVTPGVNLDEGSEPAVTFDLRATGDLVVDVLVAIEESPPPELEDDLESLVRGFCEGRPIQLLRVWSWDHDDYEFYQVTIQVPKKGATAELAYASAADIHTLCQEFLGHRYSTGMVRSVVRGGRPDLLIGQYESRWLECKSRPYDLSSSATRIELAQDVSRFANSESDGLLVVGLGTKKDSIGDRIASVHPMRETPSAARHHKILDQLIYPPIDGLEVQVAKTAAAKGGLVLMIYVPKQAEELKPFLVGGAVVHGKTEGAFISIVRRRDEHSIPVSPSAIHAALSVGRALLRTGRVPPAADPPGPETNGAEKTSQEGTRTQSPPPAADDPL